MQVGCLWQFGGINFNYWFQQYDLLFGVVVSKFIDQGGIEVFVDYIVKVEMWMWQFMLVCWICQILLCLCEVFDFYIGGKRIYIVVLQVFGFVQMVFVGEDYVGLFKQLLFVFMQFGRSVFKVGKFVYVVIDCQVWSEVCCYWQFYWCIDLQVVGVQVFVLYQLCEQLCGVGLGFCWVVFRFDVGCVDCYVVGICYYFQFVGVFIKYWFFNKKYLVGVSGVGY